MRHLYKVYAIRRLEGKDRQTTFKNQDFSETSKNDGILRSFDCLFKKTVFWEDKIKVSNKRRKSENKTLNKSTVK